MVRKRSAERRQSDDRAASRTGPVAAPERFESLVPDSRAQGKSTRVPHGTATLRHLEGAEQGPT